MNRKSVVVFVTSLNESNFAVSAASTFEEDVKSLFNPETAEIVFVHGTDADTQEQIALALKAKVEDGPVKIVLHDSCKIKKIAEVTRTVRLEFPYAEVYYRKQHPNETLQASMQKIPCFSKLLEEMDFAA